MTFVWWGRGGGLPRPPHHTNICYFCNFVEIYLRLLGTHHFQICNSINKIQGALSSGVNGFSLKLIANR